MHCKQAQKSQHNANVSGEVQYTDMRRRPRCQAIHTMSTGSTMLRGWIEKKGAWVVARPIIVPTLLTHLLEPIAKFVDDGLCVAFCGHGGHYEMISAQGER